VSFEDNFTFHQSRFAQMKSCLCPALLCLTFATQLQAADWPQFLGPNRNGVSAETNLSTTWSKEGPKILWQKNVGQGFSGSVVANEKLILFHRVEDKETVECLDAKTGKPIWKFDYVTTYQDDFGFDEGPRATPTIADGKVYTFGAEGALHCLDFASGKKLWNVDCKTTFHSGKGYFGRVCSPLVEGDFVLLNIGGENGAGIVAFNKMDGKLVWKATDDEAGYSSPVAATINEKRLALFFTRRGLVGLNPKDGKVQFDFFWRSRMDASVNAASPLVIGDLIFLSASYGTGAVLLRAKESSVEKAWSGDDILSNHYSTSVHRDGFLYGFHGRQEQGQSLRCVELKTGKVRWSEDNFGAGTVTLAGSQLYILSERGELVQAAASAKEFKVLNRAQILPFGVRAYPAVANGNLYARSKDKLVCASLTEK
jgi:outer membrane protein assembly factor BamB